LAVEQGVQMGEIDGLHARVRFKLKIQS